MTIDKSGLFGQDAQPKQSIGCLCLDVTKGNWSQGYSGNIFTGIANGLGDSVTTDGATMNVPLIGLEKKLDDIVLVNAPFFDGYPALDVFEFFSNYGGITADYRYCPEIFTDPSYKLSYSQEINVPVFEFKTSTTVKSALDLICKDLNMAYVVRDGKIFYYTLDPDTGYPLHYRGDADIADEGIPVPPEITGHDGVETAWTYDGYVMENANKNPDFEDLRNNVIVLTLSNQVDSNSPDQALLPNMPVIIAQENPTYPEIPWQRVFAFPVPGLMGPAEATIIAGNLKGKSTQYILKGNLSIPGNAAIRPYDRILYNGKPYMIDGVSHNIDLSQKKWITSMELSQSKNPY
jgi:hypothetical protein